MNSFDERFEAHEKLLTKGCSGDGWLFAKLYFGSTKMFHCVFVKGYTLKKLIK